MSSAASHCFAWAFTLPLARPCRALYVGLGQRFSLFRLRYSELHFAVWVTACESHLHGGDRNCLSCCLDFGIVCVMPDPRFGIRYIFIRVIPIAWIGFCVSLLKNGRFRSSSLHLRLSSAAPRCFAWAFTLPLARPRRPIVGLGRRSLSFAPALLEAWFNWEGVAAAGREPPACSRGHGPFQVVLLT